MCLETASSNGNLLRKHNAGCLKKFAEDGAARANVRPPADPYPVDETEVWVQWSPFCAMIQRFETTKVMILGQWRISFQSFGDLKSPHLHINKKGHGFDRQVGRGPQKTRPWSSKVSEDDNVVSCRWWSIAAYGKEGQSQMAWVLLHYPNYPILRSLKSTSLTNIRDVKSCMIKGKLLLWNSRGQLPAFDSCQLEFLLVWGKASHQAAQAL